MKRRPFLGSAAGLALLGAGFTSGMATRADGVACYAPAGGARAMPLKARARERGLLFGTAADRDPLEDDQHYARAVIEECALVTPENSMKWERLRPTPETFSFENADWLVDFAETNGLDVHGHTLTWHLQMPDWFDDVVNRQNAERILGHHIRTVASRYAGRIRSWDVVNEAINAEDGRGDGLRLTPWLRHLGPEYIELAFYLTQQYELNADLVYNDYGLEYDDDAFEQRRAHVLDLLSGLVSKGAPVHALGVQSHLDAGRSSNFARFASFLDDVAGLGLEIMITELDVQDRGLPADPAKRDCLIAGVYRDYLDVVLSKPKVRSVAVWGLSDRYSWLQYFKPRHDGEPGRPLPLDADLKRKPAWQAISQALEG